MPVTSRIANDGVATVTVDCPPVNALRVADWFALADQLSELGRNPEVRVVILRAEGRGFNAGVDIKEMQATEGFDALIGANRGCYAAFAAVYDCPVPVSPPSTASASAAVSAWSATPTPSWPPTTPTSACPKWTGARSGPPPISAGWCRSTRCERWSTRRRLLPRPSCTPGARSGGSSPRRTRRSRARELAGAIAAKSPTVIRAAKESLNGIDPWDVKRSYRFEQGFTFELNLSGVADEHRDAFVAKREPDPSGRLSGESDTST